MPKIGISADGCKAGVQLPELLDVTASSYKVDTIGVHSMKWWLGSIEAVRRTLPNPDKDCRRRKCEWGTGWDFHHPTEAARRMLADWQREGRRFSIRVVHVARDERATNKEQLGDYMMDMWECLRFKWPYRKARPYKLGQLNFYLDDGCKARNCLVYYKRPSRVRTEDQSPARFRSDRTCTRDPSVVLVPVAAVAVPSPSPSHPKQISLLR